MNVTAATDPVTPQGHKRPNHALQRTAPCVTAPASAAAFPPTTQLPRHAPPSLSLGSFGEEIYAPIAIFPKTRLTNMTQYIPDIIVLVVAGFAARLQLAAMAVDLGHNRITGPPLILPPPKSVKMLAAVCIPAISVAPMFLPIDALWLRIVISIVAMIFAMILFGNMRGKERCPKCGRADGIHDESGYRGDSQNVRWCSGFDAPSGIFTIYWCSHCDEPLPKLRCEHWPEEKVAEFGGEPE
jgi:hypothetical protein